MRDISQNTEGGNGSASPFEQAQQIVDDLTALLKDAQFRKILATHNPVFVHAESADSDGELTQEDIAATEQLKDEIRRESLCNYVRGLCRRIIELKRGDAHSIAYRKAEHCLTLVQKIEAGDNNVGRELNDGFHILLQTLRAADETRDNRDEPYVTALPIPQGSTDVNTQSMKWDVFISHASEDKEAFVRPLAIALQEKNVRVWLDEFALTVGDNLRRSIDDGLASSRYGIVVISPSFLAKEWPQKELDGLVAREVGGRKVILPVWHNVDAETLRKCSPPLSDRVAISTDKGMDAVVAALMKAMTDASGLKPSNSN